MPLPEISDEQIISTIKNMTSRGDADGLNTYLEQLEPAQKSLAAAQDNLVLMIALTFDRVGIAKSLLGIQAVRDNAAVDYNNLLRLAMQHGHYEIAKDLLTIPEVRHAAVYDNVAPYLALRMGYSDISEDLLAIQAAHPPSDEQIISTITELARNGNAYALKSYLEQLGPEQKSLAAANNNRAFQLAAIHGHQESMRCLLSISTVYDNAAAGNNLALLMALRFRHQHIAKDLLRIRTVREHAAAYNNAALHLAAINDYRGIVRDLLTLVPRNSAADENGHESTLLATVKSCNIVRDILTVLRSGHPGIERDLLIIQAFRDSTPGAAELNKRIIDCAIEGGHPDIVENLLPRPVADLIEAQKSGDLERVVSLITMKAVRHYPAVDEEATLQAALKLGYPEIARNLLRRPEVRNNAGAYENEALIIALLAGERDIAKDLSTIPSVCKKAVNYLDLIIDCAFKGGESQASKNTKNMSKEKNREEPASSSQSLCWQFNRMGVSGSRGEVVELPDTRRNLSEDEEKNSAAAADQAAPERESIEPRVKRRQNLG